MKWRALQCPLDCSTPVFIHMLPDTHTHTLHIIATPHKAGLNNSSGQQLCVHSFSFHLASWICPSHQHTHTHTHTHSQMHRGQHVQWRALFATVRSPTCPLRDCRPDLIPRQWTSWPHHAATADIHSANPQLPSPRSQVPSQPSYRQKLLIVTRMPLLLEMPCGEDCGKALDQFSAHPDITARTSPHDHGYWLNWQFCECHSISRPSIG
jgi:hypothetical protein